MLVGTLSFAKNQELLIKLDNQSKVIDKRGSTINSFYNDPSYVLCVCEIQILILKNCGKLEQRTENPRF